VASYAAESFRRFGGSDLTIVLKLATELLSTMPATVGEEAKAAAPRGTGLYYSPRTRLEVAIAGQVIVRATVLGTHDFLRGCAFPR
jgi:hypothetical protein